MAGTADFIVIGAGVIGLSIALELRRRIPRANVIVFEKEVRPGLHASGRNSGVLHSGIYYPAGSLKARTCRQGATEMAEYCRERGLQVHRLGKVLVPTRASDGPQLDVLAERAAANGVEVARLTSQALRELEPEAGSATGEALFVPSTSVVDPTAIMASLADQAVKAGIEIRYSGTIEKVEPGKAEMTWSGERICYGHAINAAGLHADSVAHLFGSGLQFSMLPFKGLYWRLDPASGLRVKHLIYPTPDLRVPFLGIHTTTAINGTVYLGPAAVPAFGRENYRGWDDVRPADALRIAWALLGQFASGHDGFRRLAWEEGRRYGKQQFARATQALLPRLKPEHLLPCSKVGIRAQLFDRKEKRLVTDFMVETGPRSTHVLNAISPAFTSAFPFGRLVCDSILLRTTEIHAA